MTGSMASTSSKALNHFYDSMLLNWLMPLSRTRVRDFVYSLKAELSSAFIELPVFHLFIKEIILLEFF